MSNRLAEILRKQIADWQQSIDLMVGGTLTMNHNGVDITDQWTGTLINKQNELREVLTGMGEDL